MDIDVILCATQRLARRLRLGQGLPPGSPVLKTRTVGQWLDELVDAALLDGADLGGLGEDPLALVLNPLQERKQWQRVIEAALQRDEAAALFNLDGLALAAREAHELATIWRLPLNGAGLFSEEARRFVEWRAAFLKRCRQSGWRDGASQRVWQVDVLAAGLVPLPRKVAFAGFDRFNPLEERLRAVLGAQAVQLSDWPLGGEMDPEVIRHGFEDAQAEFRAVAHWVSETHRRLPRARIGVVVPDLAAHRATLCRYLDEALDGAGSLDEARYNVSLGEPLARLPLVMTALALLRLAQNPWRIEQSALGSLLTGLGWSRDVLEADARAVFDAHCRANLPAMVSLERVITRVRREMGRGAALDGLRVSLEAILRWAERMGVSSPNSPNSPNSPKSHGRRLSSQWALCFQELLDAVAWPGERSLSSHEFQTRAAFAGAMQSLAGLDELSGEVVLAEAFSALVDVCNDTVFQPETEGDPPIQVLGLLEAATESFDALWVCGLNDVAWPPAPRPNPLLPAAMQRAAGCPNASPEVQRGFADCIHQRFLQAAPCIVFSSARHDGEREMHPSPLISALPVAPFDLVVPLGRVARVQASATGLESLIDIQGPPVSGSEKVAGGVGLLRAQAICPAWAFFRYRLAAKPVEVPVDGLDARGRGRLVHLVLEAFWRGRSLAEVKAQRTAGAAGAEQFGQWVVAAVDAGMQVYAESAGKDEVALEPRFAALERARLIRLLSIWIDVEMQREDDFRVVACEAAHEVDLHGLTVNFIVDRIDEDENGERLVIDYKTGRTVDASSWAEARIAEPQLPVYATCVMADRPPMGIAFAQVVLDKPGFVGITRDSGVLPRVKGLTEARKRYPEADFPGWTAVLDHWRTSLKCIADEIRQGEARVSFTDETALKYCDVLPLLRLFERRRLYEAAVADGALASPPGGKS